MVYNRVCCLSPFFKKKVFSWCGPFLKSLLNLLQYCFCLTFWYFWPRGMWDQLPDQDWNCTSCIGKWSINPWITREVPIYLLFMPTLPTTERSVFSHPLHKCENQELLVSGSRCLLRRPCPLVAPPSLPQGENQEIPVSKVWVIDTESVTSPSHKYPLVLLFISATSAKYLLGAI